MSPNNRSSKGPGRAYRKGISLIELARMFPDDATAERWFSKGRWPDGPRCPHCHKTETVKRCTHPSMPYHCRECRRFFSVKVGTVMENSNIGLQQWAFAVYLMATNLKGTSSMHLHRDLGITQKSAWFMGMTDPCLLGAGSFAVRRTGRGRRGVVRWPGGQQTRRQAPWIGLAVPARPSWRPPAIRRPARSPPRWCRTRPRGCCRTS